VILRLVRTQLRSEWRSSVLGVGVLAFALALATFSMVVAATAIFHQDNYAGAYETDPDQYFFVDTIQGDPISESCPACWVNQVMSVDEIEQLVDEASQLSPVEAESFTVGMLLGDDPTYDHVIYFDIPLTPQASDRFLYQGEAPHSGQVALSWDFTDRLNLEVGDFVTFESITSITPTTPVRLEISGILYSGDVDPYPAGWVRQGLLSWDDIESLQRSLPSGPHRDPDTGATSNFITTFISWSGDNPILEPYLQENTGFYYEDFSWSRAFSTLYGPTGWALLVAVLTVACLIVAALSMGRAQAQARTRWSATARVLGASSRAIAAASLVETVVVSVLGVGIGLGAGVGLANLHLALLRATHPHGLLPLSVSVPGEVLVAGAAVGLVLAIVLAAIPAFWASRVTPAAALKPSTPVSEATLSRSVSQWWPVGLTAVGAILAGIAAAIGGPSTGVELVSLISTIILIVAGPALVIQAVRELVSLTGGALTRSKRASVLTAGDGILSGRRAFTFAALGTFVTGGGTSMWITANASIATDPDQPYRGWGEIPLRGLGDWWRHFVADPGTLAFTAVAFGVVALVAIVVAASFNALTSKDDSIREALGLSRRAERIAVGGRQAAVMSIGTIAGSLTGCVGFLLYRLARAVVSPDYLVYSLEWNLTLIGHALVGTAAVAGIGIAFALLAGSLTSVIVGPTKSSVTSTSQ